MEEPKKRVSSSSSPLEFIWHLELHSNSLLQSRILHVHCSDHCLAHDSCWLCDQASEIADHMLVCLVTCPVAKEAYCIGLRPLGLDVLIFDGDDTIRGWWEQLMTIQPREEEEGSLHSFHDCGLAPVERT